MRLMRPFLLAVLGAFFVIGVISESAQAFPPFARKYQTSCNTCHVAVPKLNAFGRAFRLNGYFWPGGDNQARKIKPVEMGSAYFGARATIDESVPLGFFAQIRAAYFPKRDNRSQDPNTTTIDTFSVDMLSGGTFGDSIGWVLQFAADAGAGLALEAGTVDFVNLIGGHAFNVRVGKQLRGLHWNHNADSLSPNRGMTGNMAYFTSAGSQGVYQTHIGGTGLELYGVIGGYFQYQLALLTDTNLLGENNYQKTFTAFLEYQIMGMRLDGVGGAKGMTPWEDNHIRIRAFLATGTSNTGTAAAPINNKNTAFGGELEVWWAMIQFNMMMQYASRKFETQSGSGAYNKVDEIWMTGELAAFFLGGALIPVVRMEMSSPKVTSSTGASTASQGRQFLDLGVTSQIRANVQVRVGASLELNASKVNNWDNNGSTAKGNHKTLNGIFINFFYGI